MIYASDFWSWSFNVTIKCYIHYFYFYYQNKTFKKWLRILFILPKMLLLSLRLFVLPSSPPFSFLNHCWFCRGRWLMINSKVYSTIMSLKWMLKDTRFPIDGSHVQNHWVAPRMTQPFILLRLMKWVQGTSGHLVVESKLSPCGDCAALRQLNPIHMKFFIKALIHLAYSDFVNS